MGKAQLAVSGGGNVSSNAQIYINENETNEIKIGDKLELTGTFLEKNFTVYTTNDSSPKFVEKIDEYRILYLHCIGDYGNLYACVITLNSDNSDILSISAQTQLGFYGLGRSAYGPYQLLKLSSNLFIFISTAYSTSADSKYPYIGIIRITDNNVITGKQISATNFQKLADIYTTNAGCIKISDTVFAMIFKGYSTNTSHIIYITVNDDNSLTYSSNKVLYNQIFDGIGSDNYYGKNFEINEHYVCIVEKTAIRIIYIDKNNINLAVQKSILTFSNKIVRNIILSPSKNYLYIIIDADDNFSSNLSLIEVNIEDLNNPIISFQKSIENIPFYYLFCLKDKTLFSFNDSKISFISIEDENSSHINQSIVNTTSSKGNVMANCICVLNINERLGYGALVLNGSASDTYANIVYFGTIKKMRDQMDAIALSKGLATELIKVFI